MGKAKGSARRKKNIIEDDGAELGGTKVEKKDAKKQRQPQPQQMLRSKFVGVSWSKQMKKWEARITINGKPKSLGYYHDEKEAARIYDEQAALLGKPVNFPLHEGMEQAVKAAPKGSGPRRKSHAKSSKKG